MVNSTITGIALAIGEIGAQYTVYTSDVKQDLDTPCFIIKAIDVSQKMTLDNRFDRNQTFSITYFPETDDEDELRDMEDSLLFGLEYITVNDKKVRVSDMKCTISDGVLVCTADYNLRLKQTVSKDKMQNLSREGTVK